MNNKRIRAVGAACVAAVWLGLTVFAWFSPAKDRSDSERRKLEQFPVLSVDAVFGIDEKTGTHPFMSKFEKYSLDQFPLRDSFRSLKAMFHGYVLGNRDNNGFYYKDGYIAMQDKQLNAEAVSQKTEILNKVYVQYLQENGGDLYLAMVPDKSYYLAEKYAYPSMDFAALEQMLRQELPWAEFVDISGTLELEDYYRTDTHWRQEALLPTVQLLAQAMGVAGPQEADFTPVKIEQPFYGVYHGQAALPVAPDTMYIMDSPIFEDVKVSTMVTNWVALDGIYDHSKLTGEDPYNIYLSGAKMGPVVIENPNAKTDKHLVIFRDSFGSSVAPLFAGDYARITLIDLRVTNWAVLPLVVDFENADVLVLMSALALNNAGEAFAQ